MSRNERTSLAADAPVGPAYAVPCSSATALACLSGAVQRWFRQRFESPTPIQRLAWPALAAGTHVLGCAPTGSGKTLAAFVPILDRLLTEPRGRGVRCLHVSPLKALAADVRKSLRRHLRDLRHFLGHDAALPRVGLRSGDTSPRQRRHLRRHPPDLLLTTPESLAVLLSQPSAPDWFAPLRWVVVDELHALVPSKRGCDLALSLERLTELAGGPVQRIGLSATCAPLELAARFLVGPDRPCTIASVAGAAPLHLQIEALSHDGDKGGAASFTGRLADRLERELQEHRTTLIFTNSRSLAERLGWALRERLSHDLVAVHHSALAPARRRAVERALQRGRLRAVVRSTSLELGIDIGAIDRVVLVHPPGEVVRLLQRVGRAGHAPAGRPSGLVLTDSPAELLEAAVTAASVPAVQFEPLRSVDQPLDVLCQQLAGLAAMGRCSADQAFDLVRRAWPYRHLSRDDFDACLDYLSGWPGEGVERLPARLRWQEGTFTIADRRIRRLVLRNLGTILSDEPRPVRRGDGSAIGTVDPAFADRLRAGDRFLLGGLCWEVRRSSAAEVRVEEAFGRPATPRWPAAGWPLSAPLARRLYLLRHRAAEALRDGPDALADLLQRDYRLSGPALDILVDYFHEQEAVSEIPQVRTLLVEVVSGFFTTEYYLHTPLNRAANDALARVLVRRLERRSRGVVTSQVADLGILLTCEGTELLGPETMRALLAPADFEPDLQAALADSDTLRDRFQTVAYTALMLLKNPLGRPRRVGGHDWAQRRLFDQLGRMDPDFVLLRQARRDAEHALDLASARAFLDELPRWTIRLRPLNQVSPFAAGIGERAAALSAF